MGVDYMRSVCVNATLYNIFVGGRENAGGIDAVDLNVPNIYVGNVVFKLSCWGSPPSGKYFALLLYYCAGATQPYTRLCVYSGSLLT